MALILEHEEGSISLDDDVLVFVIDDTGHENLDDANRAVLVSQAVHLWCEIIGR